MKLTGVGIENLWACFHSVPLDDFEQDPSDFARIHIKRSALSSNLILRFNLAEDVYPFFSHVRFPFIVVFYVKPKVLQAFPVNLSEVAMRGRAPDNLDEFKAG